MKKYTASYSYTNPNFVIQNLDDGEVRNELTPLLYVLKNILQRGCPTVMSQYLQKKLGVISERTHKERLLFTSIRDSHWVGTIKGDEQNNYYPARQFYEEIIPNEFGEYAFVQSMIVPEIGINDIIGEENKTFIGQQVDFYLPQALLVIEIDGQQHKRFDPQRVSDSVRDAYFLSHGIQTVRIDTRELQNGTYKPKIDQIIGRISQFPNRFAYYKTITDKIKDGVISDEDYNQVFLPTAIIRFQILLIELLLHGRIKLGDNWNFNIRVDDNDIIKDNRFARYAVDDLLIWLDKLYLLKEKKNLPKPEYKVEVNAGTDFLFSPNAVNVDFSIFKKYTDENTITPEIIFVRGDYFDYLEAGKRPIVGLDRNYFRVSTTQSINYHVTDADIPVLEFFLRNIFGKKSFRDGQFSIIANALNLRDTIGLLPTGGGKSLCYQLPCLLQPAIDFVVCPIKSLMYDQADNLKKYGVGITNISYISGDLKTEERAKVLRDYARGRYLFVWISPERFQIPSFRTVISEITATFNMAYAVIDEVHCLSEWGHDFRTSYLNLARTIDNLSPKDEFGEGSIKYIGLTATASVNVLKDIKIEFSRRKQQLEEDNVKSLLDYSRKELTFTVIDDGGNKESALDALIQNEGIFDDEDKATIIFTPTVNGKKGCYELSNRLKKDHPDTVAWYAGDTPRVDGMALYDAVKLNEYKQKVQEGFKNNQFNVLCATKAFGMGIDKDNIYYTIHYGIPSSVEALYQEAGRAGRWDKSKDENKKKVGNCYVLFSPEQMSVQPQVDMLFSPHVSIDSMRQIQKNVRWNGRDIFTQLFLFLGHQQDIEVEFAVITSLISTFYQEEKEVYVYYQDIENFFDQLQQTVAVQNKSEQLALFEKEIYRLCLLGIVKDWSRDFVNYFQIKFGSTNENHVIEALSEYVTKYDTQAKVRDGVNAVSQPQCSTVMEKSIWYLLDWIFRNIVETRKQALKTLSDWCAEYKDSNSFKQRIDSYFSFNESVFILQHVAEHPQDVGKWFETFYSNGKIITKVEFKKLKDRLSRFLESYHHSTGLDFISGYVRLCLNEYDDSDGRPRFESSLESLKNDYDEEQIDFVLSELRNLMNESKLSSKHLYELSLSLIKFFPELTEPLATEYNIPQLLQEKVSQNIKKLNALNKKLYEQFGVI